MGAWTHAPKARTGETHDLPEGAALPLTIASESHDLPVATDWPPHTHPAHELVWVRRGTMTAQAGHQVFTVSEGYGLWVPAGMLHSGRVTANVVLHDAFFSSALTPPSFTGPTVVAMAPMLQTLLVYLADDGLGDGARSRAEAVVLDVLAPAPNNLAVRVPRDRRAGPVAQALLAHPGDTRSIDDWARAAGASTRTLTRAFTENTGLSFATWRQTVRIHRALELLGQGMAVQEVAEELGYAQAGSFIDAFRHVLGSTPGAWTSDHTMSD